MVALIGNELGCTNAALAGRSYVVAAAHRARKQATKEEGK